MFGLFSLGVVGGEASAEVVRDVSRLVSRARRAEKKMKEAKVTNED
jgi:hypothetical protein